MGVALLEVIENLFKKTFKQKAFSSAIHLRLCLFRYVDDTFSIYPHGSEKLLQFLGYLNLNGQIKFTSETKEEVKQAFLDFLVTKTSNGLLGHSYTHTDNDT